MAQLESSDLTAAFSQAARTAGFPPPGMSAAQFEELGGTEHAFHHRKTLRDKVLRFETPFLKQPCEERCTTAKSLDNSAVFLKTWRNNFHSKTFRWCTQMALVFGFWV